MKTQAIFTLLFLFSSVFNLNQAAPVDELWDKESILSAIDQAGLQLEKTGGWTKDDLIDVVSQMILTKIQTYMTEQMDAEIELAIWKSGFKKDDLIDVASPMILTHIKTFMTEQMDEEMELGMYKLNRILEDVGKETEEEEDSNDSKDVETSTDEEVDSNDSVDVVKKTNDGPFVADQTTQHSTSQVCKALNGKMECTVKVCKWFHDNDEPFCREYKL